MISMAILTKYGTINGHHHIGIQNPAGKWEVDGI